MRKALVVDGRVREVIDREPFPPFAPGLNWVPCDADVVEGHLFDGDDFAEPPAVVVEPPAPTDLQILTRAVKDKLGLTDADLSTAETKLKAAVK